MKLLQEIRVRKFKYTFYTLDEYQAAIDMAIKALKQESVLDKVRVEIEEHAKINQNLNTDRVRALCWCLDVIDKHRSESEDKE